MTESQTSEHSFDLFTSDGHFQWQLADRGVEVGADRLTIRRAGRTTEVPYADITQVTLSTTYMQHSRAVGQCILALANGGKVIVTSADASGLSDGRRDQIFRSFVRDFHSALVHSGAAIAIAFHSGFTRGRMNGLVGILIVATLFFVALPLGLLLMARDAQILWVLGAGAALLIPAYRAAQTNQPATYNPGAPPDLLP